MVRAQTRGAPINIRALPAQRALIDQAAATVHKSRTDFMLEAACREAENVLLNQRLFLLEDEEFDTFETVLKAPVSKKPAKLLNRQAPWEK